MNQSEAHTWPAWVAGAKSVTRRFWKDITAKRYKKGVVFHCFDNAVFRHGKPIGTARVLEDAYQESLSDMPDGDWAAEGFAWMHEHKGTLPPKAIEKKLLWTNGNCSFDAFGAWRNTGPTMWVLRFQVLTVEPAALERLNALLIANNHPPLRAN